MGELARKLAKNIRKRRGNLSQMAFAKKLGVSDATVNRIENQAQNVTIDTLELLAKRLRIPVRDLLE